MRGYVRTSAHGGHHELYSPAHNAMCKRWDTPRSVHCLKPSSQSVPCKPLRLATRRERPIVRSNCKDVASTYAQGRTHLRNRERGEPPLITERKGHLISCYNMCSQRSTGLPKGREP